MAEGGTSGERAAARACDLCGSAEIRPVRNIPHLDGPLVRCAGCGLHFVAHRRAGLAFGGEPAEATAERIRRANAQARLADLPRDEERRLNALNARWRLEAIARHAGSGRLIEVGCGRGDFLRAARERYEVFGVEPNPELAADAARHAPVHCGLLDDAPGGGFDVAASFHVIEHVDSPSGFVRAMAARLKPGGLLAIETPDIGSVPYRLLGGRWRQFIPEHGYFFDRTTLGRLLADNGLEVRSIVRVGKYASLPLILNRLGRQVPGLSRLAPWTPGWAFRVDPGDILLALATRRETTGDKGD